MEQIVKQERRNEQKGNRGYVDEPSARQKAYIQALARTAGLKMDVSTIGDKAKAARIIDSLKLLSGRMNGNSSDVRDKRVAFGMATKLVFASYAGRERDISKWNPKKFWDEVRSFYADYLQQQELAVVGSRME